MKKISKILWGIILVALGVVVALNAFEITNIDILFDGWWTAFIIIPCAIGLFTERDKIGNLVGLLVGVFLLLCCQNILSFDMLWKLAVPAVIVLIGIKMIFNGIAGGKSAEAIKKLQQERGNVKSGTAVFSGQNMNYSGEVFEGAVLTAVFGGVDCDLSNAIIEKDCLITATGIFGGADILVPDNINVKVTSTSIFGGVSDKKKRAPVEGAPTLYVRAICIFGGVDIK